MTSLPFPTIALMGSLVYTLTNFLRSLTNRDVNAAVTQAVAWAAGVAVVTLVAATDFAAGIGIGTQALDKLSGPSLAFVGLMASSVLGVVHDVKAAIDSTDSAKKPPLLPE